jgi:hypothetical protein
MLHAIIASISVIPLGNLNLFATIYVSPKPIKYSHTSAFKLYCCYQCKKPVTLPRKAIRNSPTAVIISMIVNAFWDMAFLTIILFPHGKTHQGISVNAPVSVSSTALGTDGASGMLPAVTVMV